MFMGKRETIEKIAKYKENEIGPKEENVKQKIIVPLLELLGHKREDLEFEYRTRRGDNRRGKIDIFIKNVPSDCKVVIDTKNYSENLTDHIEQIRDYTLGENALLAVIANGTEIRIYSPIRGIEFERSLLYSIKREDIIKDSVWRLLSSLLGHESLRNRNSVRIIETREKEIKETLSAEEKLREEHQANIESIESDIEAKEEETDKLREKKNNLIKEIDKKIAALWNRIGLPSESFKIPIAEINRTGEFSGYTRKAGRVHLEDLVKARLIRDGQTLFFYNTRNFNDEQALVIASSNKLKYKSDGKIYSTSELAKNLLIKHGFKRDEHSVAGPKYWKTEEGRLLNDLNEQIRKQRGDRN